MTVLGDMLTEYLLLVLLSDEKIDALDPGGSYLSIKTERRGKHLAGLSPRVTHLPTSSSKLIHTLNRVCLKENYSFFPLFLPGVVNVPVHVKDLES